MTAAATLHQPGTEQSRDILLAALAATTSAVPFAQLIERRLNSQVEKLRLGDDGAALNDLGDTTREIGEFLTYLVLMSDCIGEISPQVHQQILDYRMRMMSALASLNPALGDLDLVEVADTIEQDVVGALLAYPSLHNEMVSALQAAAA
jgi:hypothetical protein